MRWLIVLSILLILGSVAANFVWRANSLKREAELTRKALLQQGFKVDLAQFNFTNSPELAARAAALTNAAHVCRAPGFGPRSFLPSVGSNTALIIWQQPDSARQAEARPARRGGFPTGINWAPLREELPQVRGVLDTACAATLAGPVRFSPVVTPNGRFRSPHLGELVNLARALASYSVLELRDTNAAAVPTKLLALTRLTTAWQPGPDEDCHLARFRCATIAQEATWQVLQARVLTDAQLATLQKEWESLDYFSPLPETAAFSRASMLALCQAERGESLNFAYGEFFKECFRSPSSALRSLKAVIDLMSYRKSGVYEDEKALMLYFRDRETELRELINAPTWHAMSHYKGAVERPRFTSPQPRSRMAHLLALKHLAARMRYGTVAIGAAEAEAWRRVVIAALALERFRLHSGHYPASLQQLIPQFLPRPPIDFMDGQALRYYRTSDGHFVLHSIGFDGVDNGGIHNEPPPDPDQPESASRPRLTRTRHVNWSMGLADSCPDLVWPRPATPADLETQASPNPP